MKSMVNMFHNIKILFHDQKEIIGFPGKAGWEGKTPRPIRDEALLD